jgi:hypothetical protein
LSDIIDPVFDGLNSGRKAWVSWPLERLSGERLAVVPGAEEVEGFFHTGVVIKGTEAVWVGGEDAWTGLAQTGAERGLSGMDEGVNPAEAVVFGWIFQAGGETGGGEGLEREEGEDNPVCQEGTVLSPGDDGPKEGGRPEPAPAAGKVGGRPGLLQEGVDTRCPGLDKAAEGGGGLVNGVEPPAFGRER